MRAYTNSDTPKIEPTLIPSLPDKTLYLGKLPTETVQKKINGSQELWLSIGTVFLVFLRLKAEIFPGVGISVGSKLKKAPQSVYVHVSEIVQVLGRSHICGK